MNDHREGICRETNLAFVDQLVWKEELASYFVEAELDARSREENNRGGETLAVDIGDGGTEFHCTVILVMPIEDCAPRFSLPILRIVTRPLQHSPLTFFGVKIAFIFFNAFAHDLSEGAKSADHMNLALVTTYFAPTEELISKRTFENLFPSISAMNSKGVNV